MFCANRQCPDFEMSGRHGEYREGITQCPYCGEKLVVEDPAAVTVQPDDAGDDVAGLQECCGGAGPRSTDDAHADLEPVFETSDPTEVPVVRSFLDAEGIPHVVVGEERFDAFRGSLSPFRFNPRAGIVAFLVPSEYAEVTRELLVELEKTDGPDS